MSISGSLRDRALLAKAFGSEIETSIIKATSHDPVPPKLKHVEVLRDCVKEKSIKMSQIFDPLKERLRESSWVVVLKAIMVMHELIREPHNLALPYLASTQALNVSGFRSRAGLDAPSKARLIESYASYLEERVASYREKKFDFVLKSMEREERLCAKTDPPRLISDIDSIQRLINSLIEIPVYEFDNEILVHAFQLLTKDILKLYHALNEAVINILENYFEMDKTNALRSLEVYKSFLSQTDAVTKFLERGRPYQSMLSIEIPKLKIPPATLIDSLTSYLHSLDQLPSPVKTVQIPSQGQMIVVQQRPSGVNGKQLNNAFLPQEQISAKSQQPQIRNQPSAPPSAGVADLLNFDSVPAPQPASNPGNFDLFSPSPKSGRQSSFFTSTQQSSQPFDPFASSPSSYPSQSSPNFSTTFPTSGTPQNAFPNNFSANQTHPFSGTTSNSIPTLGGPPSFSQFPGYAPQATFQAPPPSSNPFAQPIQSPMGSNYRQQPNPFATNPSPQFQQTQPNPFATNLQQSHNPFF